MTTPVWSAAEFNRNLYVRSVILLASLRGLEGIICIRHPYKDVILDNSVEYLANPYALVDVIKNDRTLMKNDGGIIMALCILRD